MKHVRQYGEGGSANAYGSGRGDERSAPKRTYALVSGVVGRELTFNS